ncbi:cell division protein FtsA [Halanaerobacter jeridensis]|uniref:Cell division protein FtsA n=1 Tax=Halanaerobacter jeridensis TaxID=706427 RepID=A0A939BN10_9FIRM|nr:cell division protein FtsA [Halanaerobacter jeridensis]
MAPRNVVAGIDVGTTKICTIIAEVSDEEITDIIGVGTSPSKGLKKGMVVDIDDTVKSIEASVDEAERMAGLELESAFVGIAGSHISSLNSHGVVAVTGENKEITHEDIERVMDATKIISIPPEREIIHALPREYIVDGCKDIKYPLGMAGVRLEAETHIVTGSVTSIQNLAKSVNRAGIGVEDIVLQPLAASKAVLSESEKDLGVVLVDMGGGTTDIAVFKEGSIWYTAILPVGGDHVTSDIAVGLRTPKTNAEKIKIIHGSAEARLVDADEEIDIVDTSGAQQRTVSRQRLAEIIEPRIDEIFTMVNDELRKGKCQDLVPAGMVITGGGSLLKGLPDFVSQKLEMPVRSGKPNNLDGLLDYLDGSIYDLGEDYNHMSEESGAIFSTAVGLVRYGAEMGLNDVSQNQDEDKLMENFINRVKDWFKSVF